MNPGPAFGILGILYAAFMIVVAVLAVYALVLHRRPAATDRRTEARSAARGRQVTGYELAPVRDDGSPVAVPGWSIQLIRERSIRVAMGSSSIRLFVRVVDHFLIG